jgi:probable phosphoglycerate mutase
MTATFFLIRHAVHDLLDKVLVGRAPHVSLSHEGRRQAYRVAVRLARERLTAVYASPRERAQETAQAIADAAGLSVETAPDLDEIEIGGWTGLRFEEVAEDPNWRAWNTARATSRPPGGESMAEVQSRIIGLLGRLRAAQPHGRIATVSHGDVIRAALLHYLGLSLDRYARIEISPAGISTVAVSDWGGKIITLNERMDA